MKLKIHRKSDSLNTLQTLIGFMTDHSSAAIRFSSFSHYVLSHVLKICSPSFLIRNGYFFGHHEKKVNFINDSPTEKSPRKT